MNFKLVGALGALIFLFLIFKNLFFTKTPSEIILNALEHDYAYSEEKPNFNEVLLEVRKLHEEGVKDPKRYGAALQKMQDAHLEIRYLKTSFEQSNLILEANNTRLMGQEIVAIDGREVTDWILSHEKYVNYSSAWARDYRTLGLLKEWPSTIITGPKPKRVGLKDESGKTRDVEIKWGSASALEKCVSSKEIENVFILRIETFWCEGQGKPFDNFKSDFESALSEYKDGQEIILDLRGNRGGGDNEVRYALAPFLSGEAFLYRFIHNQDELETIDTLKFPVGKLSSVKPVILIDSGCGSSCEVFASILKHNANADLIGYQTHGCAGEPVTLDFGSWSFTYPSAKVWDESSTLYEGNGLAPTLKVDLEQDLLMSALNLLSQREIPNKN